VPEHVIRAAAGEVHIHHHVYAGIPLPQFIEALTEAAPRCFASVASLCPPPLCTAPGFPVAGAAITTARLIGRLNEGLKPNMIVVPDVGDTLLSSMSLQVRVR
jgi:TPP-dependent 2-oxoacid decarboxylase